MPLVSVIVPVYNVEPYLRRCVDSIINQTYKNLEIILVDDGSPDNCGQICDEYAKQDTRIKVIHQKNSGLSIARNNGINIANGEYILFIDSDDYVSDRLIEICMKNIDNNDMIIFDFIKDYGKNRNEVKVLNEKYHKNYNDLLRGILWDSIPSYVWNKFYKKNIWDNIRFPENTNFEDLVVMPQIFLKTNKIKYINKKLYYYNCYNNNSISNNISSKNKYGMFLAFYYRYKISKEKNMRELKQYSMCRAVKNAVTAYGLNKYDKKLSLEQTDCLMKYLKGIDLDKINIGLKYKMLFYSIEKYEFICEIYGSSMYFLQRIKGYIQLLK